MNPNSLFSQCINFISKNIICVDSLVGFPEIIGKDIFHKVCSDGNLLNHNHRGMKILLLFHEAYPDQVISRVNVNQRVVSGPTHMFDVWQNFRHITNAILSRCAIKDNDSASSSVLVHLAGLVNLNYLNLSHNELTDGCIRQLTGQLRFKQAGLKKLTTLILTGNNVTPKCMKYFKQMSRLQLIDMSGTFCTYRNLSACLDPAVYVISEDKRSRIEEPSFHDAWANSILAEWISNDVEWNQNSSPDDPVDSEFQLSQQFYKGITTESSASFRPEEVNYGHLIVNRISAVEIELDSSRMEISDHMTSHHQHHLANKRQYQPRRDFGWQPRPKKAKPQHFSPLLKETPTTTTTAMITNDSSNSDIEMLDLINMYRGNTSTGM